MKVKRLLFLVMVICLASGVKAQFYDSAEEIYYYLLKSEDGKAPDENHQQVAIFNFDGKKACVEYDWLEEVKSNLKKDPDYYPELFENKEYDLEYSYSSYGTCYKSFSTSSDFYPNIGRITRKHWDTYEFSSDRSSLTRNSRVTGTNGFNTQTGDTKRIYKKVDKSYFKVGRSRTPSGTLYE